MNFARGSTVYAVVTARNPTSEAQSARTSGTLVSSPDEAPEFQLLGAAQAPGAGGTEVLDRAEAAKFVTEPAAGEAATVTLLLVDPDDQRFGDTFTDPRTKDDDPDHNALIAAYRPPAVTSPAAIQADYSSLRGASVSPSTTGGSLSPSTPPVAATASGSSFPVAMLAVVLLLLVFAGVGGWLIYSNSQKRRQVALAGSGAVAGASAFTGKPVADVAPAPSAGAATRGPGTTTAAPTLRGGPPAVADAPTTTTRTGPTTPDGAETVVPGTGSDRASGLAETVVPAGAPAGEGSDGGPSGRLRLPDRPDLDDATVEIPGPIHPPLPSDPIDIGEPVGLVGSLKAGMAVPEGTYEAPPDVATPLPELPWPLGLDPAHDNDELVRFLSVDDLQASGVDPSTQSHIPPEYVGRTGAVWSRATADLTAVGVWFEQRLSFGEDAAPSFVFHPGQNLGLLATYDGTGGAGSATVELPTGPLSGAYLASRLTRQGTERWFVHGIEKGQDDQPPDAALHDELQGRLAEVGAQVLNKSSRIHGSLRRDLPTTLASVAFRIDGDVVSAVPLWAGDSRCHLLTPDAGLQQLTVDDTPGSDALELLINDAPMTNMVSADRPFTVNARTFQFPLPTVMVTATDGVFGYVATPAHYEFLLLSTLAAASTAEEWGQALLTEIVRYTSDDASLVLVALGYPAFADIQAAFAERTAFLRTEHWAPFRDVRPEDREAFGKVRLASWRRYRQSYEQFLPRPESSAGDRVGPSATVRLDAGNGDHGGGADDETPVGPPTAGPTE